MRAAGAILLALAACSSPRPSTGAYGREEWWELRLPERSEHWRRALLADLASLSRLYEREAARWPAAEREDPYRIIVTEDLAEAVAIARELELEGDPRVPRTHPEERLALIPLPRNDRLVLERSLPPRTWRETFRHEAAHLLSLDRPDLLGAPAWFQEGFAESWADLYRAPPDEVWSTYGAGSAALAAHWRQARPAGSARVLSALAPLPSEARLTAWRVLAEWSLDRTAPDDREPWRAVEEMRVETAPAMLQREAPRGAPALRGREIGLPEAGEGFLLAAYPEETVGLEIAPAWPADAPLSLEIEVGRTGFPEAGLVLTGAGSQRLRIRFGRFGEMGAYLEPRDRVETRPMMAGPRSGVRRGFRRTLLLEPQEDRLLLHSGEVRAIFHYAEGVWEPPFALDCYVRDGAMSVRLPDSVWRRR